MTVAGCIVACAPLRDGPGDQTEQHTQVLFGDVLEVDANQDGAEWLEVTIPDGYRGYIRAAALGPAGGAPAFVVTEPEAGGRYLGTWLDGPADGTQPIADA